MDDAPAAVTVFGFVLGREARQMLRVHKFLPGLLDRLIKRRVRQLYAQATPESPAQ